MLYAKRQGDTVFRRYHDAIFERFWKRELDIEHAGVIGGVLTEAGADPAGFPDYSAGPGPAELDGICHGAEAIGVFGVPTFVLAGEMFWGREHLPDIREMLGATA
jgi:2-hydroxychromene-2-carboxylate isomerase